MVMLIWSLLIGFGIYFFGKVLTLTKRRGIVI